MAKMSVKDIKEMAIGTTGAISGATSILGSWQICHNLCLGLIAILGVIGITLTGMPLLFFTKIAVPFWIIAVALFCLILYFYFSKHCISKSLLFFNSGLIIAGTPFQVAQRYQLWFWSIGASLAIIGVVLYIKGKITKKKCENH